MWPRVLPFATYMAFIAIEPIVFSQADSGSDARGLWLYPIKIAFVVWVLFLFRKSYSELNRECFARFRDIFLPVCLGLLVYVAWVRMDFSWASLGRAQGYDPFQISGQKAYLLVGIRLFGAAVVVPVMEELFWRSFILRYIISTNFLAVPIGKFTVASFVISTVFFGIEHHLWLAGMMAGAAYTLLLYRTGRLWPCILAHGVTNFALGVHVLVTKEWFWW